MNFQFKMKYLCIFPQNQRLIINLNKILGKKTYYNVVRQYISQTQHTNTFNNKRNFYLNTSNFGEIKYYSSTLSLNNDNIFKSTISNIPDYRGKYFHEYIWENAEKWWNKTALVCARTGRSYTYEQLRRLSGRFATSLRKSNLRPGDTIAAILPNLPEYAIILLGASEAGLQVTPMNPHYTAEEIRKQVINSETVAVITTPWKSAEVAESIQGNSTIRLPIIVIEDGTGLPSSDTINFMELISDNIEEFGKTGQKTERDPEVDTYLLPYSSGTTGLPKGVELTHRNVVANLCQISMKEVTCFEKAIGNYQEVVILFLPIYHIYGLSCILGNHLRIGAKIICMPQFSSTALLEALEKYKTTFLYLAPPIAQLLVNDERFTSRHFERVKLVKCGAAPIGEEVIDKLLKRCGTHLGFVQGYGLTETSPVISKSKKAPFVSSGLIVSKTELRIVGYENENEGKNLGTEEVGQIYVKGPQIMKGYFKNPKATQETMEGEWFKTGDLGSIDDQGFLYIRGRLKELIKVQGYQVAPAELEDILQGHEKIIDAAIIGVPHDKYGEVPKAFIVLKPHMRIDEQEIKDFVAKRVAKHKQLGHVVVIDKIPKSAAGKILRRELQNV